MSTEHRGAHDDWLPTYIQQAVTETLRNGFGDPSAPMAEGEYVHAAITCPHDGCDWQLPIEWRHVRQPAEATRLLGYMESDRLCQAHLEEHVAQSWAAS